MAGAMIRYEQREARLRTVAKAAYSKILVRLMPPVVKEILMMSVKLGYLPNIWRPRSLNEKIAHRKLFEDDPRYAALTDKWSVRRWVHAKIGAAYLTQAYQYARRPEDIDIERLPQSFVIKCTHDSGSVIIVDDKDAIDWEVMRETLRARLARRFGGHKNEYWYDRIEPALLVEERIRDERYDVPLDFKFFVFHGRVELIQVDSSRFSAHRRNLYSPLWIPVDGELLYPAGEHIPAPARLEHMVEIAEALGEQFDFVRVDLYAPNDNRVVFGEMTFAPEAGWAPFRPRRLDFELGRLW